VDHRDRRDHRTPRETREDREPRDPRDHRSPREPREQQSSDRSGFRSDRSESPRGDLPISSEHGRDIDFDDLKRIRGIGVLIEKKLNSMGVTRYDQIADWTMTDIDRVSQALDFKGRIERENWVEQARILASGGQTEFSRRADRGDFTGA
jgi:predicted flap endonuclease-1-like 5' DNA nuclease